MIGTDEDYFICSVIEVSSDIPRPVTIQINGLLPRDKAEIYRASLGDTNYFDNNFIDIGEGYYHHKFQEFDMYDKIMKVYRSINTIF